MCPDPLSARSCAPAVYGRGEGRGSGGRRAGVRRRRGGSHNCDPIVGWLDETDPRTESALYVCVCMCVCVCVCACRPAGWLPAGLAACRRPPLRHQQSAAANTNIRCCYTAVWREQDRRGGGHRTRPATGGLACRWLVSASQSTLHDVLYHVPIERCSVLYWTFSFIGT